jgi:hypothetical protein
LRPDPVTSATLPSSLPMSPSPEILGRSAALILP